MILGMGEVATDAETRCTDVSTSEQSKPYAEDRRRCWLKAPHISDHQNELGEVWRITDEDLRRAVLQPELDRFNEAFGCKGCL